MTQVFWLFDVGVISGVKEEWNLSVWGRKSEICFAFLHKGQKGESTTPLGFPGGSVVKNPSANAGDSGLILGLGRFPGEGNCNQLQYSCLGNLMDRGAWQQATVIGVTEESDKT